MTDPHEQVQLCHAALENQLGSAELKQVLQLRRRSQQPIEACVRDVLRLRPQIQRIHVFLGAITSKQLVTRLSCLSQAQRDEIVRTAVRDHFPRLCKFGCRLGTEGFAITGGDEVHDALTKERKGFEAVINGALSEAVSP